MHILINQLIIIDQLIIKYNWIQWEVWNNN